MGVFQNILVEQLPVSIIKFGVLNHWRGEGEYSTEVRILAPDRQSVVVSSQQAPLNLQQGGYTDNVSFFVNVLLPEAGTYWVQTMINGDVFEELPLYVIDGRANDMIEMADDISETIN